MIETGVFLGVVPARGGSKGLPGKNVRLLGGKPLVQWTVFAARESRELTDFLVSTDDAVVADSARAAGAAVPFLRPAELSTDDVSVWPAVRHAVEFWEQGSGRQVETVVLLQPTSPLRTGRDIDDCVLRWRQTGADVCATVCVPHDNPYFNMVENDPDAHPFVRLVRRSGEGPVRRQDAPVVRALNGAVYVVRRGLLEGKGNPICSKRLSVWEMPRNRSVDIDGEEDLALAEFWLGRREASR